MGNMWDLPRQTHPVHGRRAKKHTPNRDERYERHYEEERPEEHFEKVGKTITDAAITVVGIGGTLALGGALLGALKPK